MSYSFVENTISDLHKDAYGFRPSPEFSMLWKLSSDDQKQEIWDDLVAIMQRSMEAEEAAEKAASEAFEGQIQAAILSGAADRETAIRWVVEALDLSEAELMYGGEHVCFLIGIPFSYTKELDAAVANLQHS